jgi:hypothetical protein
MGRKTRKNRYMKKGKIPKKLSKYTMKMAKKTARLGTRIIKDSATIVQAGTEKLGSEVAVIAEKSAPVIQKGLEGIFDTLKNSAKYTLNKADDAGQSIAKTIRRRRSGRSRRLRKSRK